MLSGGPPLLPQQGRLQPLEQNRSELGPCISQPPSPLFIPGTPGPASNRPLTLGGDHAKFSPAPSRGSTCRCEVVWLLPGLPDPVVANTAQHSSRSFSLSSFWRKGRKGKVGIHRRDSDLHVLGPPALEAGRGPQVEDKMRKLGHRQSRQGEDRSSPEERGLGGVGRGDWAAIQMPYLQPSPGKIQCPNA